MIDASASTAARQSPSCEIGRAAIPLSTAEKCVFTLEKRPLGAGNPIVIRMLSRFWRRPPAAEIERGLHRLAADWQWNSTACSILLNSAYRGSLSNSQNRTQMLFRGKIGRCKE